MDERLRPFCEASDRNKDAILEILRDVFNSTQRVLEVASGTGQHAVYFAAELTHLTWLTSELPAQHAGICAWIEEAKLANVSLPLNLDVNEPQWPIDSVDGVFSANTAHIMSWSSIESMFEGVARVLELGGVFALYGPFSYDGRHTSASNARFDESLRARDPSSGIRDFELLDALAARCGMQLEADHAMPANNRTLVWRRS